jgi:hypothetical protein
MRTIKPSKSVAILAALILVTALTQAGSAATRPDHELRSATASSNCDPNDLPGGPEGPDDDGDECNFTITGHHFLPPVNQDSTGEFAQGSPQNAKKCNRIIFDLAQLDASNAIDFFNSVGAPTAAVWLRHFLDGTHTPIHLGDNSMLASEVKSSSVFKNYDAAVQAEAKKALDSGQQDVTLTSSIKTTPNFYGFGGNSDPRWAFGGTQGVDITGNGFPQHGQYVGELTYTIRDIYGFYNSLVKLPIVGWEMHYLQGRCGAPFYKGGAQWFEDSVTVKVKFQQPIG